MNLLSLQPSIASGAVIIDGCSDNRITAKQVFHSAEPFLKTITQTKYEKQTNIVCKTYLKKVDVLPVG